MVYFEGRIIINKGRTNRNKVGKFEGNGEADGDRDVMATGGAARLTQG